MNPIFLTTGTKNILLKVNQEVNENSDITIINSEEVGQSHLTLEAPNLNDFVFMWEIITTFATVGGAIGFLQIIRNTLVEEQHQSYIAITTNTGMSIDIYDRTSDIQIQEFVDKTIIIIPHNA